MGFRRDELFREKIVDVAFKHYRKMEEYALQRHTAYHLASKVDRRSPHYGAQGCNFAVRSDVAAWLADALAQSSCPQQHVARGKEWCFEARVWYTDAVFERSGLQMFGVSVHRGDATQVLFHCDFAALHHPADAVFSFAHWLGVWLVSALAELLKTGREDVLHVSDEHQRKAQEITRVRQRTPPRRG